MSDPRAAISQIRPCPRGLCDTRHDSALGRFDDLDESVCLGAGASVSGTEKPDLSTWVTSFLSISDFRQVDRRLGRVVVRETRVTVEVDGYQHVSPRDDGLSGEGGHSSQHWMCRPSCCR